MSERDAFDRILASMHEATLDDGRWPTTSRLIDDVLGAKGNSLVFGGGRPGDDAVRIFYAGFFYRGQRHREWEREYFSVYYPEDERVERIRRLPDSQLVPTTGLYTDSELKTSPAFNEALLRGHVQNGLNVRLDGPGDTRITWVVNDPVAGDGWSSDQIECIQRLLPHVRQYVSVRQVLAGAGALDTLLAALLETTGPGVIQLDWQGRIVAASDGARRLLRAGDRLCDTGGSLCARSPTDDAVLQRLLSRALPPLGRQAAGGSMVLRRPAGRNPLELHVSPVGPREASLCAWPVAALVLVAEAARRQTVIGPDLLAAHLGLTRAEARVAVMLAEGKSVRDIAESTGRGTSTIRTHVQRMFRKLGIARQTDLVRLVLSISAAPGPRP
ncbi:MAG: helix-turn-helix transcriptional regulator [Gammaproteobacteria bacterium]|nr:helix-turn-helix transcriptional regulator [Gammaproteobacteria bacterium]